MRIVRAAVVGATFIWWLTGGGNTSHSMDYVNIERDGELFFLAGRVEIEAEDGGLLLLERDGTLWAIQPAEIQSRRSDEVPFATLTRPEAIERALAQLPEGFSTFETAHYVILHSTSKPYAEWVASLYERLYRGFYNYWDSRGLELKEPTLPLLAIIYADPAIYAEQSRGELGAAAESIVGYYSLRTNRMTTYDLTGQRALQLPQRPRTAQVINQVLAQPQAEALVATIIHEATHQLAYNSGLQTRYADNPLWLSEGLAIYFETPDLRNSRGWRNIGKVHRDRLATLRPLLNRRDPQALLQLLTDDAALRQGQSAKEAYAQAWGLCFFLSKRKSEAFTAYLAELAILAPLVTTSSAERLATFRKHFGDLAALDEEFVRYMRSIR